MAEQHRYSMENPRLPVKPPARRVRQRLSFVVIEEASQFTPAFVVAKLDQASANLGTKQHPTQCQHRNDGWTNVGCSEEYRQEACLQQHRFPAERIKLLPDVDDGEIQHPEHEPYDKRDPNRTGFRNS